MTQTFITDNQVMATVTFSKGLSSFFVSSNPLFQCNPDGNRKLCNIILNDRYILHMLVLLEYCYM